MATTSTVRFLRDAAPSEISADDESYENGKTYTLPSASADRWIRRGAAEGITTATAPVAGVKTIGPGPDTDEATPKRRGRKPGPKKGK
jgi:hypothetical protein